MNTVVSINSGDYYPHDSFCGCLESTHGSKGSSLEYLLNSYDHLMRHGTPEGNYFTDSMQYEEFIRALNVVTSMQLALSENGRSLVRGMFEKNRISLTRTGLILSSMYHRAQETAEIGKQFFKEVLGFSVPMYIEPLLNEVSLDPDEWPKERYTQLFRKKGIEGIFNELETTWLSGQCKVETVAQTYDRARKLLRHLDYIKRSLQVKQILLVSHGTIGRSIIHAFNGGLPELFNEETRFIQEAEILSMNQPEWIKKNVESA